MPLQALNELEYPAKLQVSLPAVCFCCYPALLVQ